MTDTAPPAPRRRRGLVAGLVVLLVVLVAAAVVWTGLRALSAKRHLDVARADLVTARQALLDRRLDAARTSITDAGVETHKARDLTGDPVTGVLAHVPWAGRTVRVGRTLAASADDLARTTLPQALTAATQLDPAKLRRADGSIDLALVRASSPGLSQASSSATAVQHRVDDLPTSFVLGPVSRGRASFQTQVDELADTLHGASDAVAIAPRLLGGDGVRRWFVLVQQTSESRGTGGLPGGFAVVEANAGKITVLKQGSNADLKEGQVDAEADIPADFRARYNDQDDEVSPFTNLWQNINQSPDLPVVARYLSHRYQVQSGIATDGVIAVDGPSLQDLLQGSDPITIGARQVPADGIAAYLGLGQYADNPTDQVGRKDQLSGVASAVLNRFTRGGGDSTALLKGITTAVRSGHLRMATTDRQLAPVLHRDRVDGSLPTDDAPFTYAVVQNTLGSKLDYFLDRSVSYEAGACRTAHRRSTVTVTLTNRAPAVATLPPYVTIHLDPANPAETVEHSSDSQVALSVYATRGAELDSATLDGVPQDPTGINPPDLVPGTEAGLPVWQVLVDLPVGKPQTLVLHFVEPSAKGTPRILQQPLARDEVDTMSVPAC